jgi:release factor glutamine methyltransferase
MHVAGAMALARERGVDRLDAQLLLAHRLGRPRSWLLAHDDAPLAPADEQAFLQAVVATSRRHAAGVPGR